MAFVVILMLTAMVLAGARYLPGRLSALAGPHQMTVALALPLIGTFGLHYAIFAACVIGLMLLAPGFGRSGLVLPGPGALDLRCRLFLLCLPLMPMMVYTIAIGGLTFAQFTYVHLLSMGLLLAMLMAGERIYHPRLLQWDILLILMLIVQAFMDCRGNDLTYSVRACNQVILNLGLPYLAISRAFIRSRSPNDLMLSVVLGGCILALIVTFEAPRHWLLYDTMPQGIGADPELSSGYAKQRGGLLRGRASFPESTGLSLLLGLDVVILVALRRHLGSRLTFFATLALLASGVFFTLARIGYIVIVAGLIACMVQERRWVGLCKMLLAMPVCAGLLLLLSRVIPTLAASIGTGEDAAGSVDYRSELLSSGMALVRENWGAGLSMPDLLERLEHLRQGEGIIDLVDQPLTILMRGGVIGAAVYYAILLGVLNRLFARGPVLGQESAMSATSCFAGLVGLMASLTTTSYGRNETTYVMLLAAGAGLLARRRASVGAVVSSVPFTALMKPSA
ncbi:O-antigen ligase family protein [Sphingobium limneticum]|jgi:hypothetical protein|uniref:O-antigen ligase family protein n=1 Tax=Sphingobium limneticum TaxID=1007511 RepID=UPI0032849138